MAKWQRVAPQWGGRPLGRVPELLFILSLLERRGFAARLFFAFFFFAVSTGSAHGLVSRRSRDSRATNRLWSGGLSIAAWTSRLLQIPGAIVCGMFGGKISALCPAVLAPWGPGRCVPTGGTPPPPDPLIDPRGVGGGAAWDNWLGTGQMWTIRRVAAAFSPHHQPFRAGGGADWGDSLRHI